MARDVTWSATKKHQEREPEEKCFCPICLHVIPAFIAHAHMSNLHNPNEIEAAHALLYNHPPVER